MIRTFEVNLNAAHPELRMFEAATFVGSPSTAFIRGVPPQVGAWRVMTVFVAVVNPDNTSATIEAKKGGDGVWTATIPATNTSGRVAGGFQVLADGIDENGDAVTGYVLGVADFTIFDREINIVPGRSGASVLGYFSTPPASPKTGDVAKVGGILKLYDGTAWVPFGSDYSLPVATAETLGGVKVGSGLSVTQDGTLSTSFKRQYVVVPGAESDEQMPTFMDFDEGRIVYDGGDEDQMPTAQELLGGDMIAELYIAGENRQGIGIQHDGTIIVKPYGGEMEVYEDSVVISDIMAVQTALAKIYAAVQGDSEKPILIVELS